MAIRLLTVDEFHSELNRRECRFVKQADDGYGIWKDARDEIFSVPPPEEILDGVPHYPDWMLDDLIECVGLPDPGPACH